MVQQWSWSTLLEKFCPCLQGLGNGGGNCRDSLLWDVGLKQYANGQYSMAVVQANSRLEDQSQVFASSSATYVGIFDGHGGPAASQFVNRHLFPFIHKFAREQGGLSTDVIKKAFNKTEEEFVRLVKRELPLKPRIASVGSCCLVGIVLDDTLFVANLGDSRAVLGLQLYGNKVVAERLTTDHNVGDEEVRKEVVALHPDDEHIVIYCRGVWRIKGIIQVSRSIGDVYLKNPELVRDPVFQQFGNLIPLKRPVMTAEPSIKYRKLKSQDLFIIFASDGLWEQLSDEVAVQIVSKSPRKGIAKRLVRAALEMAAKKQSIRYADITYMKKGLRRQFHDDITVIVVYLDHHSSRDYIRRFDNSIIGSSTAPSDIHNFTAGAQGVST